MKAKKIAPLEPAPAEERLSRRVLALARAARVRTVICVAESENLYRLLHAQVGKKRLLAATSSRKACQELESLGIETLLLPLRFVNRFKQAQYAIATAVQKDEIKPGERVVCSVGSSVAGSDFILTMDVGQETVALALHELVRHTKGIRPAAMESVINVACEIARAARRGKRLGAIFVMGDSESVLAGSRQLVPNPFDHLDNKQRSVLHSSIRELLVELAKLDGAFVVNSEGLIVSAGTFLSANPAQVQVPQGLGTRHLTAAAVTARTRGTAIVVSATDGHIRVFARGDLVLHVDPESF